MAQKDRDQRLDRLRRGPPSVTLPVVNLKVNLPDRGGMLWYAGLGAMAAAELVEWPVAALLAGTHFVENHVHNRDMKELAEGIDAGA